MSAGEAAVPDLWLPSSAQNPVAVRRAVRRDRWKVLVQNKC